MNGLRGVVADPFGSSLCLILAGLFFAGRLYRMNLLTIGDYYKQRFNRPVEIIVSLCIVVSYLGWVSAQITAMGLVFSVLTDGAISLSTGMIIGATALSNALASVWVGRSADRLGRRSVYGAGLGVFMVASAACGAAPSAGALFAARAAVLEELGRHEEAAEWFRRAEIAADALDAAEVTRVIGPRLLQE